MGESVPQEIEVTPKMIEAGLAVLDEMASVVSSQFLLERVYKTMALAAAFEKPKGKTALVSD